MADNKWKKGRCAPNLVQLYIRDKASTSPATDSQVPSWFAHIVLASDGMIVGWLMMKFGGGMK